MPTKLPALTSFKFLFILIFYFPSKTISCITKSIFFQEEKKMVDLSKIEKMENFFHQWYSILNPLQKIDADNFLSSYPISEIENDIFSAAEKNNIEIEVPPARLFQVEVDNKVKILECKFIPFVTANNADSFRKELFNLFEITKITYPDKHITFYCMCPFIKSFSFSSKEYQYGILGTFWCR